MGSAKIEHLISLIESARRLVLERARRENDRYDPMSMLRLETLRFIAAAGSPTMKDVAAHLHITAPSATSLVNGLSKGGLVARSRGTNDRRVVCMSITPKGRRRLEAGVARLNGMTRDMLSVLPERDIDSLIGILTRLTAGNGITLQAR